MNSDSKHSTPPCNTIDCNYGRRIESDRSWTVYHVFTGTPARVDGRSLTGLSRSDATDRMLSLNQYNIQRRKERNRRPQTAVTSIKAVRPT